MTMTPLTLLHDVSAPLPHLLTGKPMTSRKKKLTAAAESANRTRAESTGQRQAARAREALIKLQSANDRSHQRWIDVLRHRAKHPSWSLRELAETMTPPMTKSAYAALLRRALRAADELK